MILDFQEVNVNHLVLRNLISSGRILLIGFLVVVNHDSDMPNKRILHR
jgi:hypothetical protein